jgi:hypothetical protein
MNNFQKYQDTKEKQEEFSEYVHLNYRLIMVKMQSEMRRKLEIEPSQTNENGYHDLMASINARLFNEMVYALTGFLQAWDMNFTDLIPNMTTLMLLDLMAGKNPLNGEIRKDVVDLDTFNEYYMNHIAELRKNIEALPK